MNEVYAKSQALMLKFLQENFPIKRLKDGKRFKRGMIIEGEFTGTNSVRLFMSYKEDINRVFILLSRILEDVFAFSRLEINTALLTYLNVINGTY